jgi:hypothetical protein
MPLIFIKIILIIKNTTFKHNFVLCLFPVVAGNLIAGILEEYLLLSSTHSLQESWKSIKNLK